MRVPLMASVRSVTAPSVSNQESPMDTQDLLQHLPERARFSDAKMTKLDCFRSDRLLIGLNCFEPGQEQTVHTHAGADKFYLVVAGKARFAVGHQTIEARTGDLILAPEGVPHGVERALERTVVLVAIAPAP
ncbi:MAG: cupin domain-containing protein [Gemmatimonadetes bacterium]|nr:MAG: cupin domain-containing protein [Gemmatimonadota bacterium]PYP75974.1 MAG: cupin domain-containing protein [Gemmatimonadota bacterium]